MLFLHPDSYRGPKIMHLEKPIQAVVSFDYQGIHSLENAPCFVVLLAICFFAIFQQSRYSFLWAMQPLCWLLGTSVRKTRRFLRTDVPSSQHRRFGRYEVIDFLVVLFGYAISGERTLETFYERLQPFAAPFMALFERDQLPARSTLSRFLAALTEAPVEALRTLFLDDLLSRPLSPDKQTGGLVDRAGNTWMVFDIDGTREAARQHALPQTEELPLPIRRLDDVCAPGYTGRKRGEIVRTRTVVSQAHSYQW